jgi:hypothetical protein
MTTDRHIGVYGAESPARTAFTITPSDTTDLENVPRGIMVNATGDVKVDFVDSGTAIVLPGLLVGVVYPFRVTRVYDTGTTATGLVGLI